MRHRPFPPRRAAGRPASRQAGFTLIEMLVATGLVVLMLLLFARIFGDTVGIMRKQQSLIQNDQRARNLDTILRNDLNKMTFRQPGTPGVHGIVPLNVNWPVDPNQQGFFYCSINDPENPVNNVLQFTINQTIRVRDKEVATLRGRAQRLGRPFTSGQPFPDDNANNTADDADLGQDADLNQPDYDDGTVGDNLGQSSAAEVVYFVRNGNLYRRVLLLRDPPTPINVNTLGGSGFPIPPDSYSSQPGIGVNGSSVYVNSAGNPHLANRKFMRLDASGSEPVPVYSDYSAALQPGSTLDAFGSTPGRADFWSDFDYSAFNHWNDVNNNNALDPFPADRYELVFNGIDSLLNHPGGTEFPIALPQHRFGHRPSLSRLPITAPAKSLGGQPMEFLLTALSPAGLPAQSTSAVTPGTNFGFIGRFTHGETSSSNTGTAFGYPGIVPQDGVAGVDNPFLRAYANGWDDFDRNGIVDIYSDGPRTGEDLLISNVEAFDIEVWDDGFTETDINGNGTLDAWEDTNGNGVFDTLPGIFTHIGHDSTHPGVAAAPYFSGLGHFRQANNQNVTYGPRNVGTGFVNRVYDTWHPLADVGAYAPIRAQRSCTAPYALYRFGGSGANVLHRGRVGSEWAPNWGMYAGHYIFPGVAEDPNYNNTFDVSGDPSINGEDANGNGLLDPGEDINGNNALDPNEIDRNGNGVVDHYEDLNHDGRIAADDDGDGFSDEDVNGDGRVGLERTDDWSYYYKVIGYIDTSADPRSGSRRPEWLRKPGHVIYDGNVIWKCFDNRVPLQMIRITCRYRDPASGAPRQVSIVHSFVD